MNPNASHVSILESSKMRKRKISARSKKPTSRINSCDRSLKGTAMATMAKTSPAMISDEPSISPASTRARAHTDTDTDTHTHTHTHTESYSHRKTGGGGAQR